MKKKNTRKNPQSIKAVVLGMEHHNALGVARQLHRGGIEAYGVIINYGVKIIGRSRYWAGYLSVLNEEEGLAAAVRHFGNNDDKPVLITCTDRFAKAVDARLDYLKQYFICPGVPVQGGLAKMMNKKWQFDFAKEHGIKMAPSIVVNVRDESADIFLLGKKITENKAGIEPPYILKPLISADGSKDDIKICDDEEKLKKELIRLGNKGYENILVQHYMDYEYEVLIAGACFINCTRNKFVLLKIIRSYPSKGGTSCFRRFILDKALNDEADRVITILRRTGYKGLLDVELFYKDGEIYLNEFNLRSSGSSFAGNAQKFYYAADYAKDAKGVKIEVMEPYEIPGKDVYTMMEYSDIRYPLFHHYGLRKWFRDFRKVKDFAYLHFDDPVPMLLMTAKVAKSIMKKEW